MPIPADIPAPDITTPDISLRDVRGSWVVLYFYPKDDTATCTVEACDFRDNMHRLTSVGAVVIGVSPDSATSHQKFRGKYDLNFTLVSDPDKEICRTYGVWAEKSMYGRKYMGVERTTFIIDPSGTIRRVFQKVRVKGHVDEVMKTLHQLQS